MSITKIICNLGATVASVAKCFLMSGVPSRPEKSKGDRLIVMGNGPSLRDTIREHGDKLRSEPTLAVNFAANTKDFADLRPCIYVLADPHFFKKDELGRFTDKNVERLWEELGKVDWKLTLYVPCRAKIPESIGKNTHIRVKRYNLTPIEGFRVVTHLMYDMGLGMPRPRNVLIAALMVAFREGYRDIAIVGADHTWSRDLWVDDKNRVISVQKHFYEDNPEEFERVAREYQGYHLHDILNSLTIAFRSYHEIAAYTDKLGGIISNCTPGSFIDAFTRRKL